MAKHEKYLLTVDAETRRPVKVERVGEAGDLEEVSLESLGVSGGDAPSTQVINVYVGNQPPQGGPGGGGGNTPGCIIPPPRPRPKPDGDGDDGDDPKD